jgi:2,3-bisphosphoglycerate-independent phosphoglycerate mutase
MPATSRSVLIVLDGFGIGKESPFNAVANAKMPFYGELLAKYPHSKLLTHGECVGLPDGVMGNSEVGHMTMGAGRIVYQDLTRISKAIRDKEFFQNPILRQTIDAGARATGRVHLMGLLSDGGVHSHIDHLFALLDLCAELRVPEVFVHCFTDGRDTPPTSSLAYMRRLIEHPAFRNDAPARARVGVISGRYFAMDRDKRWDRVAKAYLALTGQVPAAPAGTMPVQALEASHRNQKTDEFIEPVLLDATAAVRDGDSLVFFNYRSDRARELTEAFTRPDFAGFDRGKAPKLSAFCGMTVYDRNLNVPAAYPPQSLQNIFGEWLEKHSLRQFRIAETEKYAHVTFFFNAGREQPFQGEDRVLVPSPKDVPTYDLKPEMSADQVAVDAAERISRQAYDFVLMNFANADMVGHTGNYEAAVRACEALDRCLAQVVGAAERNGYHVLLTADHGNAEEMRACDSSEIHTQHTLNPVPALWIPPNSAVAPRRDRRPLRDGTLEDVMPTLCDVMGLPLPREVTGRSLLDGAGAARGGALC